MHAERSRPTKHRSRPLQPNSDEATIQNARTHTHRHTHTHLSRYELINSPSAPNPNRCTAVSAAASAGALRLLSAARRRVSSAAPSVGGGGAPTSESDSRKAASAWFRSEGVGWVCRCMVMGRVDNAG